MNSGERRIETTAIRGLATVAFLKARFDEGRDHIDMFTPFVMDALNRMPTNTIRAIDIQDHLYCMYGISMPQYTLGTLLHRLVREGLVRKEQQQYIRLRQGPEVDIASTLLRIEESHKTLAHALRQYASQRQVVIPSDYEALELILSFLEQHEVAILLESPKWLMSDQEVSRRELRVVAGFLKSVVERRDELAQIVQGIIEGLVLCNAAFLRDVANIKRSFRGLRVFFDSHVLRKGLGYESGAQQHIVEEMISLLKATDVQCLVFDKTIYEVKRILNVYENRIGTNEGRRTLFPTAMTRYFVTQQFTPSDIRQMLSTIEHDIAKLGLQIVSLPKHVPEFTLNENALATALANERTGDPSEPRVVHDVDCIAAVLTLRGGHRSISLEGARAVFATDAPGILIDVGRWFREEGEIGLPPVVHVRVLTNLAWLKRPAYEGDLQLNELVALCAAALRPTRATWERFLRHLTKLEKTKELTSEEAVAIVVSGMTDQLLARYEDDEAGKSDETLDEVVQKVRSSYRAEVDAQIIQATRGRDDAVEREKELRRRVDGRIKKLAKWVSQASFWIVGGVVCAGAVAIGASHGVKGGIVAFAVAGAIAVFLFLEVRGILGHLEGWRVHLEDKMIALLRNWLL